MPGSALLEDPDAGREGLRRVLVDGTPVLVVARAGGLYPVEGSLAKLLGTGRDRLHQAVDRGVHSARRWPLPRTCCAHRRAGGLGHRRDVRALGHGARRGVRRQRRLRPELRGARPELFLKAPAWRCGPASRCSSAPTRPGRARARAGAGHLRPRRDRRLHAATICRRARSRARTRCTCRKPRSTTTRSAARADRPGPHTARPALGGDRARDPRDGSASSAASVGQRDRSALAELVARSTSSWFPAGAVLLTGTGVVPPDDFTLGHGDQVSITIAGIGVLEHDIYRSSG